MSLDAPYDEDLTTNPAENKNTRRKTATDMRVFTAYLVSINESREPENIPPAELDNHLATYFSIIKKHDGNEYEPASLRGMLCSIERYLRSKDYPVSLTRDIEFINTRNTLKEKQKILREFAKTEKYEKQDSLASLAIQRLNQLYLAKEFGPHNATSVVNVLCFSFVVHLKIKKAIDHKQLLWGDITLCTTAEGEEYLTYTPLPGYEYCRLPLKGISGYKLSQTNQNTTLWDPISIYKLYTSKRPISMMTPSSPFYLGVATNPPEVEESLWYKPVAMGVNKLNDLVRMIRDLMGSVPNTSLKSSYSMDNPADYGFDQDKASIRTVHQPDKYSDSDNSNQLDAHSVDYHPTTDTREDDTFTREDIEAEIGSKHSTGHLHNTDIDDAYYTTRDQAVDHDAEDTDVTSNMTDMNTMKMNILSALSTLDSDKQREMVTWLNCLYVDKDTGLIQEREPHKIHLDLNIEIDSDKIRDENNLTTTAIIKIKPTTTDLRRQDLKTTHISINQKQPQRALSVDNTASLNHTYNGHRSNKGLKRTMSGDTFGYNLSNKASRLVDDNDNLEQGSLTDDKGDKYCSVSTGSLTTGNVNTACLSTGTGSVTAQFPQHVPVLAQKRPTIDANNFLYAPLSYDPRVALMLRNDYVQTYRNLLEMYGSEAMLCTQPDK